MDRTGIARGTLRPCVYFVRRTDMYCILAPAEIGGGTELARMVYERKYEQNWMWCEADTLQEVDRLQKRLVNQEIFEAEKKIQVNDAMREKCMRATGEALRSQMISASTSQWEKDFIREYLKLRGEKRDRYRDTLSHHNHYILAREMDSSRKPDEMLPTLPGQFERTESGGVPLEVSKQIEKHNAQVARIGA